MVCKGKTSTKCSPPVAWLRETSDPLHHIWQVQNYQLTDDWLITDAFRYAIRFGHKCTAGSLLEKVVDINPKLAQRVQETTKTAFLDYLVQHRSDISMTETLPVWEMLQLVKAKVALVNADIN